MAADFIALSVERNKRIIRRNRGGVMLVKIVLAMCLIWPLHPSPETAWQSYLWEHEDPNDRCPPRNYCAFVDMNCKPSCDARLVDVI